jgi:ABC-type dipeptide/oligopeptide/nickel transport system permease component
VRRLPAAILLTVNGVLFVAALGVPAGIWLGRD